MPGFTSLGQQKNLYWTDEQIEAFNESQRRKNNHPLTCGNNRTDEHHLDGEGRLVATRNGLMCPYCDYRQYWVNDPPSSEQPKEIL